MNGMSRSGGIVVGVIVFTVIVLVGPGFHDPREFTMRFISICTTGSGGIRIPYILTRLMCIGIVGTGRSKARALAEANRFLQVPFVSTDKIR